MLVQFLYLGLLLKYSVFLVVVHAYLELNLSIAVPNFHTDSVELPVYLRHHHGHRLITPLPPPKFPIISY
uniref:Uncharacterized protein n=1 Tax=Anguilla anguilla TaxID=7936 RepID=A0A0E9QQ45_ANGAN